MRSQHARESFKSFVKKFRAVDRTAAGSPCPQMRRGAIAEAKPLAIQPHGQTRRLLPRIAVALKRLAMTEPRPAPGPAGAGQPPEETAKPSHFCCGRRAEGLSTGFTRGGTGPCSADGAIAQLGERLNGIREVGGSIPPGSTKPSKSMCWTRIRLNASLATVVIPDAVRMG